MLPFLPLEISDTAYNDTQGRTDMKTCENCRKELYNLCECIFHQLATKKCECQCSNNDLLPGQFEIPWAKKKTIVFII